MSAPRYVGVERIITENSLRSENASMPGVLEREILLAPDIVARATAVAASGAAQRWMLSQPRTVRRSYVADVLDVRGGEIEQQIWMLRQGEPVRASYIREVARRQGAGPQVEWMLSQPDSVRESFVCEVLLKRQSERG